MDGAKKLAYLLEGCGAKYARTDATEGTLFTVSTGDGQYFVLVRDDDAGIEMWSRYFTPEQAIVATVGRGNLTAEQVREAIMSADRWRKPMGDTGMTNTHLIIRDDGWQAIADELNATVGRRDTMGLWPEWEQMLFANVSDEVAQDNLNECVHDLLDKAATMGVGTCHSTSKWTNVFKCSVCGFEYDFVTDPYQGPKFCPRCGRKVVVK